MSSAYICQPCWDSKVYCPHGDDGNCLDLCVNDWDLAQSCMHNVIQCMVCESLWKGNRTLCEHSSSDVIAGFLRRVR